MEEGQTLSTGRIELWRNSITIDNRLDRVGGGLSFPVSVQLLGGRELRQKPYLPAKNISPVTRSIYLNPDY